MYSNGIAKVDIQGVLEFVRGREDFVELVRRHMGDDCAQLVRELSQEVKAGGGTQAQERRRAKGVYRGAEEGKADANCIHHALQGGRIRFCRHDSI